MQWRLKSIKTIQQLPLRLKSSWKRIRAQTQKSPCERSKKSFGFQSIFQKLAKCASHMLFLSFFLFYPLSSKSNVILTKNGEGQCSAFFYQILTFLYFLQRMTYVEREWIFVSLFPFCASNKRRKEYAFRLFPFHSCVPNVP